MDLAELLAARVPRYTSYPTAPHFDGGVTSDTFLRWLGELPPHESISLYVHIPFCDSLCWFCGCQLSVVNSYAPVAAYVDVLLREIDILAQAAGARRTVTHMHFGGGSPTILKPDDFARVTDRIRARFDVTPTAEFAVEIDPRGFAQETAHALARAGVTRASLGVQEVNPLVQRAVNRWQPIGVTREAVTCLRDAGITAFNFDLMYGLPHQTTDDVRRTVEQTIALEPQRVAVFGYAHVPDLKRHQQLIDAAHLPDAGERLRQYESASADLSAHGYQAIGLDHFAHFADPLAGAQRLGKLRRNFQGYTDDEAHTLVGLGASAISSTPQGYAQNASAVRDYRSKIHAGQPATARGRALSTDDRLRRAIIERLMCYLEADLDEISSRYGRNADELAAELRALASLEADGLVRIDGRRLRIPVAMRVAVRLVASKFDAYLAGHPARHSVAV